MQITNTDDKDNKRTPELNNKETSTDMNNTSPVIANPPISEEERYRVQQRIKKDEYEKAEHANEEYLRDLKASQEKKIRNKKMQKQLDNAQTDDEKNKIKTQFDKDETEIQKTREKERILDEHGKAIEQYENVQEQNKQTQHKKLQERLAQRKMIHVPLYNVFKSFPTMFNLPINGGGMNGGNIIDNPISKSDDIVEYMRLYKTIKEIIDIFIQIRDNATPDDTLVKSPATISSGTAPVSNVTSPDDVKSPDDLNNLYENKRIEIPENVKTLKDLAQWFLDQYYAILREVTYLIRTHKGLPTWVDSIKQLMNGKENDLFALLDSLLNTPKNVKEHDYDKMVSKLMAYKIKDNEYMFDIITKYETDNTEEYYDKQLLLMSKNEDMPVTEKGATILSGSPFPQPKEVSKLKEMQQPLPKKHDHAVVRVTTYIYFDAFILGEKPGEYTVQRTNAKYPLLSNTYKPTDVYTVETQSSFSPNDTVAVNTMNPYDWGKYIYLEAKILSANANKYNVLYVEPILAFHSTIPILRANVNKSIAELKKLTANIYEDHPLSIQITNLFKHIIQTHTVVSEIKTGIESSSKSLRDLYYKEIFGIVVDSYNKMYNNQYEGSSAKELTSGNPVVVALNGLTVSQPKNTGTLYTIAYTLNQSTSTDASTGQTESSPTTTPENGRLIKYLQNMEKQLQEIEKILPSEVDIKNIVYISSSV